LDGIEIPNLSPFSFDKLVQHQAHLVGRIRMRRLTFLLAAGKGQIYEMEWGWVIYAFCAMFLWAICIMLLVFQSFASGVYLHSITD